VPEKAKEAIIILDGLPATPTKKSLMMSLSEAGFAVIYPRYQGTWESEGYFLKSSPIQDVSKLLNFLKNKKYLIDIYNNKPIKLNINKIHVLGVSFGGSVALGCSNLQGINKIIALSPVIDYRGFGLKNGDQNLADLIVFIKKALGFAYRFYEPGIKEFISGFLLNPSSIPENIYRKKDILIIHGDRDLIVPLSSVKKFSKKIGLALKILPDAGHLSLTEIRSDVFQDIVIFLNASRYKISPVLLLKIFKRSFGGRLKALLLYGSLAQLSDKTSERKNSDIDLIIILDEPDDQDLRMMREAMHDLRVSRNDIQFQLLYEKTDFPIDPHFYSINTCGNFFIEVLKKAVVLYGVNPFLKIEKLADKDGVKLQLLGKIQQYLFTMQNCYANADCLESKRHYFIKKTNLALVDYLVCRDLISDFAPKQLSPKVIKEIKKVVPDNLSKFLMSICTKSLNKSGVVTDNFFEDCISIARRLHSDLKNRLQVSLKK